MMIKKRQPADVRYESDGDSQLISIIVPVFNAESYLDRCIQSIIRQDYNSFELILIDDGSTDHSREICDAWSAKDDRIRVYHKENGGQSSARNKGLDQTKGAYISFVDSDDYVTPDYLSYLLSLMPEDDSCRISACNHYVLRNGKEIPNSAEKEKKRFSAKEAMESVLFHGSMDVSPWAKLYKKEVFADLRFPEGRIFEDTWLFGDVLSVTESVVYGCRCCYYYDIHEGSTVRKQFSPGNLQYIEAAKKLAEDALRYGQDMKIGGIRRVNHARLSVLRYMEHCDKQYLQLREDLRKTIIQDAPLYLNDPRTPKRDRVAVTLLKIGIHPFYLGWRFYEKLR